MLYSEELLGGFWYEEYSLETRNYTGRDLDYHSISGRPSVHTDQKNRILQ